MVSIYVLVDTIFAACPASFKTGLPDAYDAALIAAPSSTKNSTGERDPEMHQSSKGRQWHFGKESPHRGRCRLRPGPRRHRHAGQRERCDPGTWPAAR
jgi:hypothetical protein